MSIKPPLNRHGMNNPIDFTDGRRYAVECYNTDQRDELYLYAQGKGLACYAFLSEVKGDNDHLHVTLESRGLAFTSEAPGHSACIWLSPYEWRAACDKYAADEAKVAEPERQITAGHVWAVAAGAEVLIDRESHCEVRFTYLQSGLWSKNPVGEFRKRFTYVRESVYPLSIPEPEPRVLTDEELGNFWVDTRSISEANFKALFDKEEPEPEREIVAGRVWVDWSEEDEVIVLDKEKKDFVYFVRLADGAPIRSKRNLFLERYTYVRESVYPLPEPTAASAENTPIDVLPGMIWREGDRKVVVSSVARFSVAYVDIPTVQSHVASIGYFRRNFTWTHTSAHRDTDDASAVVIAPGQVWEEIDAGTIVAIRPDSSGSFDWLASIRLSFDNGEPGRMTTPRFCFLANFTRRPDLEWGEVGSEGGWVYRPTITKLPEPLRVLAQANQEAYGGISDVIALSTCFEWGQTDQGFNFWREVNNGRWPAKPTEQ